MDFGFLVVTADLFLKGVWVTFNLVFLSLLIGFFLAIYLAKVQMQNKGISPKLISLYSIFFRGTPLLIQLYIIYFGLSQFKVVQESVAWIVLKDAYYCTLLAFVLNTTAYTTEIFKGVFETVPKKQIDAGLAFGMNESLLFRRIIVPNSIRRAIPAYSNECVFMLHGSAIASVVTINDITGVAREVYAKYYNPFEAFISAGVLYLCLTFIIIYLFKKLEKKYSQSVQT